MKLTEAIDRIRQLNSGLNGLKTMRKYIEDAGAVKDQDTLDMDIGGQNLPVPAALIRTYLDDLIESTTAKLSQLVKTE